MGDCMRLGAREAKRLWMKPPNLYKFNVKIDFERDTLGWSSFLLFVLKFQIK